MENQPAPYVFSFLLNPAFRLRSSHPTSIHQDQTTHHFMDQNMSWEVLVGVCSVQHVYFTCSLQCQIGSTNPAQQGAAPFSQFPSNQHGSAPLPPIDDAMMVELGLSGLDNSECHPLQLFPCS